MTVHSSKEIQLPYNNSGKARRMINMVEKEKMIKDERTLLLYFETCLVDKNGKVNHRRMNSIDFDIAKRWSDEKFITFKRIPYEDIVDRGYHSTNTHQVSFTDEAFTIAHALRKERALRHTPLLEK